MDYGLRSLETEGPFLEAFGAGLLWTLKLRYDFRFFGLITGKGTRDKRTAGGSTSAEVKDTVNSLPLGCRIVLGVSHAKIRIP